MRRRSFLHTLLIPLLPAPQLPLERPFHLGTVTGRLSCAGHCSRPNLQTIRKGLPVGKSTALADEVIRKLKQGIIVFPPSKPIPKSLLDELL